jgi:hypothetical protein
MGVGGFPVLVCFPDARRALLALYSVPEVGKPLEADVPGAWTVTQVRLGPGEFEGGTYPCEVDVEGLAEAPTAPLAPASG